MSYYNEYKLDFIKVNQNHPPHNNRDNPTTNLRAFKAMLSDHGKLQGSLPLIDELPGLLILAMHMPLLLGRH